MAETDRPDRTGPAVGPAARDAAVAPGTQPMPVPGATAVASTPRSSAPSDGEELRRLEAGLDALETHAPARTPLGARLRRSVLPPLTAVVLVLAVWQLGVSLLDPPEYKFPGPLAVGEALLAGMADGTAPAAAWNSVSRGVLGFAVSVLIGTPLGMVVARVPVVRTAVGPVLSGLQSLPSVAWVPVAIVLFGLSNATVYAVVLLGAVPSIANGLVAGVDQVPPLYLRAGRVLGARGLATVRHVLLPAALPGYLAGLKQGWAFSWRSLMATELIAQSPELPTGLGQLLEHGRQLLDMPGMFAAILLILLVGIGIDLLFFAPLERRVLRSRGLLGAAR